MRDKVTITKADVAQVRIVEAVGTAVHSDVPGLGEALEAAMTAAVLTALAEGVSMSDTKEILRRKFKARDQLLRQFGS